LNEGFDICIQDLIKNFFNKRDNCKVWNNPVEQMYKFFMKSSYGKMTQKPIIQKNKILNRRWLSEILSEEL